MRLLDALLNGSLRDETEIARLVSNARAAYSDERMSRHEALQAQVRAIGLLHGESMNAELRLPTPIRADSHFLLSGWILEKHPGHPGLPNRVVPVDEALVCLEILLWELPDPVAAPVVSG